MTEAIFGLVGVVIGGMLTAGGDWLRDRHARLRTKRIALRLVDQELASIAACLKFAIRPMQRGDDGPVVSDGVAARLRGTIHQGLLNTESWEVHRETVADHTAEPEWATLCSAQRAVKNILGMLEVGVPDEVLAENVEDAHRSVMSGYAVTHKYVRAEG